MATGHPDWFKGIVLYGIGPEEEFIPIRTDELGNLHVGYGTHAITHQDGGSDEISCEGLEGILHLEQKSSWVKVSGKPTTFAPSAHKTSHQNAGGDEISVAGLSGVLADEQKSSWALVSGKPTTFTPSAHKASHQNGGGDEISVAGLLGVLAAEQPSSWALVTGKPGTFTPSAHKTSHQNGGGDEISVAGLSGLLADAQNPITHSNASHDPIMVEADGTQVLSADWDIGDGRAIRADQIKARDGAGLKLTDDSNYGIFVNDGGDVDVGTSARGVNTNFYGGSTKIHGVGAANGGFEVESGPTGDRASFVLTGHNAGNDGDYLSFTLRTDVPDYTIFIKDVSTAIYHNLLSFNYLNDEIDYKGNTIVGVATINSVTPEDHQARHRSGGADSVPLNALDVTGTVNMGAQKVLHGGNAGASLLHWTITVTTSWQSANLSAIVGSRVALVLIEIRNGTGSNHLYCLAPAANNAYYYSDTTWERGTAVAQVDNGMRNFLIVTTASNGYLYLRGSTNHTNATDFYLVGFI
jgi:hypothetical protein